MERETTSNRHCSGADITYVELTRKSGDRRLTLGMGTKAVFVADTKAIPMVVRTLGPAPAPETL